MPAVNPDFNRTLRDKAVARTRHPNQELRLPGTLPPAWAVAEKEAPGPCAHHWRIDTPNGTFSDGVCRKCGAGKQFRNSAEESGHGEYFGQAS